MQETIQSFTDYLQTEKKASKKYRSLLSARSSKAGSFFEGARNRKTGADECNGFKFLFIISGQEHFSPGNDLAQHCGDSYVLPICVSGGDNGIRPVKSIAATEG